MKFQLCSLMLLIMSQPVSADISQIQTWNVDPACGTAQTDIAQTIGTVDGIEQVVGESLQVHFDKLQVEAQQPGIVKKSCKVEAVVTIPGGYRILPLGAAADGSYQLQPQGSNNVSLTVTHMVSPTARYARSGNSSNPWTGSGDFTSRVEQANKEYLGCSNREYTVTLTSFLDFRLEQKRGSSSVTVNTLRYDVLIELCGSYFDGKKFSASMQFGSSNPIAVQFAPYGDSGRLTGDNGVQGVLRSVAYGDKGMKVSGIFEFGGRRGQFSASIVDRSTGEFRGTLTLSDGATGVFYGSRVEP